MELKMIKKVDRESVSRTHFHWTSILSGTAMTLGFGTFFILLGNSLGLNVYNSISPVVHGSLKFFSWLYVAVTIVVSYGLGAMFSTRSNDVHDSAGGALHGIVSWGLTTTLATLFGAFFSATAASILKGVGPNDGNWLAVAIVAAGLISSALGGMAGKTAVGYREEEEREATVEREKRAGVG